MTKCLLHVDVEFEGPGNIDEAAETLSRELFFDVRFVGKNEGIRDEYPALRLEKPFFGMSTVLCGNLDENVFTIEMKTAWLALNTGIAFNRARTQVVNIGLFVACQLSQIPGIRVLSVYGFE